jgi:hypothetical protein
VNPSDPWGPPTRAASPLNATDLPKLSLQIGSEAVNLACWVHTVPLRTYTCAAPLPSALSLAEIRHGFVDLDDFSAA